MELRDVIAELEGAAQQEAAGIAILETTHFEPELGLTAERCLAAAKRRAEGLCEAARLLRLSAVLGSGAANLNSLARETA
ncbi:MAG: hypothetical protein DI537_08655 [Stutzerimonas stutzeri]|nr:MAG: hypothetical protein DI537_08655 [Stutzerimonas stutzeri]